MKNSHGHHSQHSGKSRRRTDDFEMEDDMSLEPDEELYAEPTIAPPRPSVKLEAEPVMAPPPRTPVKLDVETVGRGVLFLLTCMGLVAFGIPLLLLSVLKSPELLQNMVILGIPYQKLVFAFLLSAAITAYVCMFFLKMKPTAVLLFFSLFVFSCLPLMIGLRNNLTLQQVILEIPFFRNWPFFLRPGYILLEFLIPAAIFVCLGLQIQTMIGRKPYRFAFLFVGLYLGIAVFFGFSALTRAGQPNLVDIFARLKDGRQKRTVLQLSPAESPGGAPAMKIEPPPVEPAKPEIASYSVAGAKMDRKLQLLSDKVDRVLEVLALEEERRSAHPTAPRATGAGAGKEQNPGVHPPQETASAPETAGAELSAADDPGAELRSVSGKLDRILEALNRVRAVLPAARENMPAGGKVPQTGSVSAARSGESSTVRPGAPASEQLTLQDLKQKVQALSEKMDRVMATLDKMEDFLPSMGKKSSK